MPKILLVEDNDLNRDMLLRRLKRRGYEVVVAIDGAESIESVKREAPDLILMDMSLPVMDGYQATRILKEHDETRRIPVLGLSAHAMTGDADRALEAGCDDYDTKPIELRRLLGKIEALLAASAPPEPAAPAQPAPQAAPEAVPRADAAGRSAPAAPLSVRKPAPEAPASDAETFERRPDLGSNDRER